MARLFFTLLFPLHALLIPSNEIPTTSLQSKNDSCQLLIYSSFGCYYDINIKENGEISCKTMVDRKFTILSHSQDSLVTTATFNIKAASEKKRLKKVICDVKSLPRAFTTIKLMTDLGFIFL